MRDRRKRIAVAALGGYGRQLQLPRSDLDVLVLHEEVSPEVVRALAERSRIRCGMRGSRWVRSFARRRSPSRLRTNDSTA